MSTMKTEPLTIIDDETDLRIIKEIQQGNRDAFAELYERHNAWLMAVAYKILQNRSDTEDLLHDMFLEIWKKAASYDSKRGSVRSWLAVKIRSRALDRMRALSRVKKQSLESGSLDVIAESSSNESSSIVDHIQARQLLEKLTPIQRNIIELCYFKGFSCQEIANYCQMPLGTVKSRLLRTIQILRKELNINKVSHTCW